MVHKFYADILPQFALAQDLNKYRDKEISVLLFELLLRESKRAGSTAEMFQKDVFKTVLSAIKDGVINPSESPEKQYEKFEKYEKGEQSNCLEYWQIYIPPIGKPILACEGCEKYRKGEIFY